MCGTLLKPSLLIGTEFAFLWSSYYNRMKHWRKENSVCIKIDVEKFNRRSLNRIDFSLNSTASAISLRKIIKT
jgi:hypothetical protein